MIVRRRTSFYPGVRHRSQSHPEPQTLRPRRHSSPDGVMAAGTPPHIKIGMKDHDTPEKRSGLWLKEFARQTLVIKFGLNESILQRKPHHSLLSETYPA
jgi:hypothetical protein